MARVVLVTGSSGLVGHALMKVNVASEATKSETIECEAIEWVGVTSKDADLRDYDQVMSMLKHMSEIHGRIDGIVHLAANVGGLFKNMAQPVEMLEDNLLMNTNILRAAHAANIHNVIMCLSTCVFPDEIHHYPITAKDLHKGPPHPSNEGYAHAKRMCEVATRAYQKQYGRRYFCVVPTNIYGEYDNFDLQNAHVIPALIHKCWLAKRASKPFVVAGDGTPLRQFIYSDDLGHLIAWAYANYTDIETPFLLCPPDSEVPISHVVELIAKEFDYADHIVYDTTKPNGQFKKTASSADVERVYLGPTSPTSPTRIEDGIRQTVAWFTRHIDDART